MKILILMGIGMLSFSSHANTKTIQQIFCDANAANLEATPEMPGSLKCTPAPVPYMLGADGNKLSLSPSIIKNQKALIALGKMFFWDSQVGSDGVACASCHFQAGADNRIKNQINPGLRNASGKVVGTMPIGSIFDFMASKHTKGPNYTLTKLDFPFRKYQEDYSQTAQSDRNALITYDSDDVISSQGAYHATFNRLTPSGQKEMCTKRFPMFGQVESLFNVGGKSVRQVEPRNTPTVINAVYNFRNFWDGRANNVFNGVNPFGMRKVLGSDIYTKNKAGIIKNTVVLYNSSLASQAVGPALSDFEMSCAGKDFSELGKKMLSVKPLGKQKTDLTDSVLGPYTNKNGDINSPYTYKAMIQSAFNDNYWNVSDKLTIGGYKLIENNFSLFWGLAVQAYESTLISDDSRFDQATNGIDNLTPQEQNGLNLFLNQGKCVACHLGAEFTAASTNHITNVQNVPGVGKYTERMLMGDGGFALYDSGFYNIGVRPTEEDLGVGGSDPYGNALSFTRNAKKNAINAVSPNSFPDPFDTDSFTFPSNIGCINWNPDTTPFGFICSNDPIVSDERDAVDGAFKTSTIRNVELTGPYFHNGGFSTLEQVVQFYNRGGDRKDLFQKDTVCGGALTTIDAYGNTVVAGDLTTGRIDDSGFGIVPSNMAPDMAGTKNLLVTTCNTVSPQGNLGLTDSDINDIVAFMKSLTDERVRWEKAPFDHPSLEIPNGHMGNETIVFGNPAIEQRILIPAVGTAGRAPKNFRQLQSFETQLK